VLPHKRQHALREAVGRVAVVDHQVARSGLGEGSRRRERCAAAVGFGAQLHAHGSEGPEKTMSVRAACSAAVMRALTPGASAMGYAMGTVRCGGRAIVELVAPQQRAHVLRPLPPTRR